MQLQPCFSRASIYTAGRVAKGDTGCPAPWGVWRVGDKPWEQGFQEQLGPALTCERSSRSAMLTAAARGRLRKQTVDVLRLGPLSALVEGNLGRGDEACAPLAG